MDLFTHSKKEKIMTDIKQENRNTKTGSKKALTVTVIAGSSMLAAVAAILQYLEIGLPFMPFFIKFDFSDLPALFGAFAYGPISGILIELVKNIIHCAVSQSATVGELANFLLGAVFTGTAGLIYSRKKTKRTALLGGIAGAVLMGLLSIPINYFVVYPFYFRAYMPEAVVLDAYRAIAPGMSSIFESLLVFNLPFTVVKGLISVGLSMLIYKPLSPILKSIAARK